MKISFAKILAVCSLLASAPAMADIPHAITYQGRLMDSLGVPLSGEYQMTFTIYDMPEGGNSLWSSGPQIVPVEDGQFMCALGQFGEIPDTVFLQHFERWLGISVEGGPELTPRTVFNSVAFAYRARYADASGVCEMAGDAEHAMYADTAAFARAAPGGGFTLPYSGSVTTADVAFAVDNEGTGPAVRGDSEVEDGVIGWTGATGKSGVYGYSVNGIGVSGRAEADNHGVFGESNSTSDTCAGVYGQNLGTGPGVSAYGPDIGLRAGCGPTGTAGIFDGDIQAAGNLTVTVDSGMAGRFISDSLGIGDSGVVYASYSGKGMGTLPAAVIGISHTTDTLGMGGYFEGDYIGVMAQIYQDEDMADRVGMWSWVEGGTNASRNTGVKADAVGKGNSANWGVDAVAEGGLFNYGIVASGQEDFYGIYDALLNVGGYFEARGGDTCIAIKAYTNTSDTVAYGVYAGVYNSLKNYGGYFDVSSPDTNYGLFAEASGGDRNYGIYAKAPVGTNHWAGYFDGDIESSRYIFAQSKFFKIDHPLDPENKYLIHASVESPDQMNVYNGNVVTDGNGRATVTLPEYFEALNTDFRYQLTVIGEFAHAVISEEIRNNRFGILTDRPYVKVSWQVTGIRNDAAARARKIQVEMDKPESERGTYLDPEAYGLGEQLGVHHQNPLHRSDDRRSGPIGQHRDLQGRRKGSER